jgi:hypothetical protein
MTTLNQFQIKLSKKNSTQRIFNITKEVEKKYLIMIRKLFILGLTNIAISISAQVVNIPDANFKAYLVGNYSINTNHDSEIQVSEAVAFTGSINCMRKILPTSQALKVL